VQPARRPQHAPAAKTTTPSRGERVRAALRPTALHSDGRRALQHGRDKAGLTYPRCPAAGIGWHGPRSSSSESPSRSSKPPPRSSSAWGHADRAQLPSRANLAPSGRVPLPSTAGARVGAGPRGTRTRVPGAPTSWAADASARIHPVRQERPQAPLIPRGRGAGGREGENAFTKTPRNAHRARATLRRRRPCRGAREQRPSGPGASTRAT